MKDGWLFIQPLSGPLFLFGIIWPAISYLMLAINLFNIITKRAGWCEKGNDLFMPLIGPFFLSLWIVVKHYPLWILILPWILDPGTVLFYIALPKIIKCEREISRWTKKLALMGEQGIESVVLSFHNTGKYYLKRKWNRRPGQVGMIESGEVGCYSQNGDTFELTSNDGWKRSLRKIQPNEYEGTDVSAEEIRSDYSLNGWKLTVISEKQKKEAGGTIAPGNQ